MSKQIAARTREKWVDDVKVIACILVALGHFFMSIHNADFSDTHDVCSIDESGFTEVVYRKFCDSCGAGTRN